MFRRLGPNLLARFPKSAQPLVQREHRRIAPAVTHAAAIVAGSRLGQLAKVERVALHRAREGRAARTPTAHCQAAVQGGEAAGGVATLVWAPVAAP